MQACEFIDFVRHLNCAKINPLEALTGSMHSNTQISGNSASWNRLASSDHLKVSVFGLDYISTLLQSQRNLTTILQACMGDNTIGF